MLFFLNLLIIYIIKFHFLNCLQASRFKLNHSTNTKGTAADHALWVGDLSADVDDYGLYKCFAARYNSVQLAKGL